MEVENKRIKVEVRILYKISTRICRRGRGQQLFNNCKLPRTLLRVHTIFIRLEPFSSTKIRNNNARYIPQAKTVNTGYHCAICIYIYV